MNSIALYNSHNLKKKKKTTTTAVCMRSAAQPRSQALSPFPPLSPGNEVGSFSSTTREEKERRPGNEVVSGRAVVGSGVPGCDVTVHVYCHSYRVPHQ